MYDDLTATLLLLDSYMYVHIVQTVVHKIISKFLFNYLTVSYLTSILSLKKLDTMYRKLHCHSVYT